MMKCRLFSALLLLFTLMAAGCSGQPAAVTADDLADQVYIYEKEGFGSDFYIALNSDGSMRCSEGALSSYFGLGTWKLDGDTVILTTDDEKFVNRFAVEDRTLVYQSADSTGFMYLTVSDGEKFLPSGAPVGASTSTRVTRRPHTIPAGRQIAAPTFLRALSFLQDPGPDKRIRDTSRRGASLIPLFISYLHSAAPRRKEAP